MSNKIEWSYERPTQSNKLKNNMASNNDGIPQIVREHLSRSIYRLIKETMPVNAERRLF